MRKANDLAFRLGTGFFGLVLILIVTAIGTELWRQSWLSIQKFGLNFWRTDVWDPVAGEFGALPFIWGTLYSAVLALLIAAPVALGIAVFISELSPGWLRQPLVFLTELLAAMRPKDSRTKSTACSSVIQKRVIRTSVIVRTPVGACALNSGMTLPRLPTTFP